jgi:glycerol-3-phosphate O-acyltransferase/dihydroxyacetone phosphate acyltransferase
VVPPAAGSAAPPAPPLPRPRRRRDRWVAALARLVVRVFFRGVETTGAERLPASGPLLIVGNHQNGLIDPLLLVAALSAPAGGGRMPRFLATHLLWRNPALRPWLELGGVIPIYRPKDVGPHADPAQNAAAFARCHAELGAGGVVALFPEGTSHSQPALAPLKTGAARIVLEAVRRYPGIAPRVVPIGLTFEAKATLRSRALVEVGEPLDPAPEIAADRAAGGDGLAAAPAAVHELTARIDRGLKAVTLNYPSWPEALLLARAGDLFARDAQGGAGGLPGEGPLAARSTLQRSFIAGYGELSRRAPGPTAAAVEAVGRYERLLAALGLRDDQVAASYPLLGAARWCVLTLLRLTLYLPLAVLGMLLNWVTYRVVGRIAAHAEGTADVVASHKVFGGIVLFPLTWGIEAGLAAWLVGPPAATRALAALVVLAAAPLAGWVALHFDDHRIRLWNEARAYVLLRSRRAIAGELRTRRAAAAGAVASLASLAAAGEPQSPS